MSENWTNFYGDVEEELPADMPKPLGEPVRMTVYMDSDHAGNLITRRSQTGYIIMLQFSGTVNNRTRWRLRLLGPNS